MSGSMRACVGLDGVRQNGFKTNLVPTYDDGVSEEPACANTVSFETFFKLMRPSIVESATLAHMDAVFKRTCILLNTKTHVYYRKAGINTEAVPRVWEINAEYLTEEGKRLYGLHKGGTKEITDDFVEEVKKEQLWVEAVMHKRFAERSRSKEDEEEDAKRNRIREQAFGERPAAVPSVTQQMQDKQKRALEKSAVSVKKEKFEMEQEGVFKKAKTWSLNMQSSGSVIDLDSSPQKVVSPSPVAPDHAQPKEATRAASSLLCSQESIEMDQAAEEMDEAWLHPAGPHFLRQEWPVHCG